MWDFERVCNFFRKFVFWGVVACAWIFTGLTVAKQPKPDRGFSMLLLNGISVRFIAF